SAINGLTLSRALSALVLGRRQKNRGPLGQLFDVFNRGYGKLTDGYVGLCRALIRKSAFSLSFLAVVALAAGLFAKKLPSGFLPEEDQGFLHINVQLPLAASLERMVVVG